MDRWCRLIQYSLVLLATASSVAMAESTCGLMSLQAAGKLLGVQIDLDSFLDEPYFSGAEGSSLAGLVLAGRDSGLSAAPIHGAGIFDLRLANSPVILHVQGSRNSTKYDHWLLFVGEHDGQIKVFDPIAGATYLDYGDLLSRWDGSGVALAKSDLQLVLWRTQAFLFRLFAVCAVAFALRAMISHFIHRHRSIVHASLGSMLLIGAVILGGLAYDVLSGESVFLNRHAFVSVASKRNIVPHDKVDLKQLMDLMASSSANELYVIDSRYADDIRLGSIPGAIHLPIDAPIEAERAVLERLRKTDNIIVFCQSSSCPFAEIVASRLTSCGYVHVRIYPGGFTEWQSRNRSESGL
jgi:rhodanese-related sulfurtransferase